ncbi:hypothetical protein AUEXF2481DRAFT_534343 [Aureobasidium subglaciale EXF-2481]|uniref:Uncharacterized protein n=1 Tax=Aureobasidium subglaciale (strain EXF-2481) TaxID=1043005 RepID=A0A074Y934_AURSE|nr:uncharacterized protein AUEXF2481DRAFT_534343 [Aureobasidium subglaciale EXF-2481]KEQ90682.1 hypothetical protein AUEXF2481DRAFT_534343 [Aureobasidium subglaciale EXF-2481]
MLSVLFAVRVSSQSQAEQRSARALRTYGGFCLNLLPSCGVASLDRRRCASQSNREVADLCDVGYASDHRHI